MSKRQLENDEREKNTRSTVQRTAEVSKRKMVELDPEITLAIALSPSFMVLPLEIIPIILNFFVRILLIGLKNPIDVKRMALNHDPLPLCDSFDAPLRFTNPNFAFEMCDFWSRVFSNMIRLCSKFNSMAPLMDTFWKHTRQLISNLFGAHSVYIFREPPVYKMGAHISIKVPHSSLLLRDKEGNFRLCYVTHPSCGTDHIYVTSPYGSTETLLEILKEKSVDFLSKEDKNYEAYCERMHMSKEWVDSGLGISLTQPISWVTLITRGSNKFKKDLIFTNVENGNLTIDKIFSSGVTVQNYQEAIMNIEEDDSTITDEYGIEFNSSLIDDFEEGLNSLMNTQPSEPSEPSED